MDVKGQRLFLISEEQNSLFIINLTDGKELYSTDKLNKPKSLAFVSHADQLFVIDADGLCRFISLENYSVDKSLILGKESGIVYYDVISKKLFAGYLKSIAVIDSETGKLTGNIKLSGKPGDFDFDFKRNQMFVNIPDKSQIEVIDLATLKTINIWKISGKDNVSMAADYAGTKLFSSLRKPSGFITLGTYTGRTTGNYECASEPSEIFFDPYLKRIYISCTEGFLQVFQQNSNGGFDPAFKLPTMEGSVNMLMIPLLNRIYLAYPGSDKQTAEIGIYRIQN